MSKKSQAVTRWQKDNPKKIVTHQILRRAIETGIVVRQPCRDCGSKDSHGHHWSYDHPLDVIWLCAKHHMQEHKRLRIFESMKVSKIEEILNEPDDQRDL